MLRRALPLLCLAILCQSGAQAQQMQQMQQVQEVPDGAPASQESAIGYASPDAALKALQAKPGVNIREENDWFVIDDASEMTLWSIATPQHPVYPTAVKRSLIQENGTIDIRMHVLCGASKEACDDVVEQFRKMNAGLAESLNRKR
ncbi:MULTISPECIES: hypothetical protein [unclassified Variovorax]|uniref:hypothetical protein n=1 Tax=unclassified Variovorax TaxID=663243 RepID=UPI001160DDBC|nr:MULTISPECIES: hypothetical protein [unclassified Variovorax]